MSSIPSGAVPITFAADRTQIDNFLAELRRGVTVPLNLGGGAGGSSFLPGLTRPSSSGGQGGGSTATDRQQESAARRVDNAWDRAMLAQQKAAEAAERRARAQEDKERRAEQRERERANTPTRIRDSDLERATPIRDSDLEDSGRGGRIFGLRPGRIAQYATAGFLLNEGARSVRSYQEYQNEMTLARTGMQRAQAEMGFANAVSGLPVVGQIAAVFTNPARLRAEQAMQGAEQSQLDVASRVTSNAIRREAANIFGTNPESLERQRQALRDNLQTARSRANEESDPSQAVRLIKEADALHTKTIADIGDINAIQRHAEERQQRLAGGLGLAARGRFGEASEAEFEATLRQQTQDAVYKYGPDSQYVADNLAFNDLRRKARTQEIGSRVRLGQSEGRALGFELARDSQAAQRERLLGKMEHDLEFAASPEEAFSIGSNAAASIRLLKQQRGDAFRLDIGGLRARNESLDILVNGPGMPAERERASAVDAIKRRTQLQELAAFQEIGTTPEQKAAKVLALARGGALELGALQQDFFRGLKPEEVSINRTAFQGAGTEDAKSVLENLQKAIEELQKLPKDIADAIAQLDALATD